MKPLLIVFILLAIPVLGFSTTIHVPTDYLTIQEAIDAAMNGDTVLVDPGTYVENIHFNGKAITVKSSAGAEKTVIDGNQAWSVVVFGGGEGPDSILDGFTITNGRGTKKWGGMFPTWYGGGIFCNSSPTITNNRISGNLGDFGGGIYCKGGFSPTITNNTISGNISWTGGIDCYYSSPTITNNTISGNFSLTGGGICCDSTTTITNSILWGNIAVYSGVQIEGDPQVTYSDVQGGWSGTGNIDSDPLFVDPGYWDDNGTPSDPNDDFWVDGDYHLTFNSPCRGSGGNGAVTGLTDFEGDPRIAYGTVDMGADEFHTHLYYTGNATPGGSVDLKFIGLPGASPVGFWIAFNALDEPIHGAYGDWHLLPPMVGPFSLGSIQADGIFILPGTPPATPPGPYNLYLQAIIGTPHKLTNLCTMQVQ